MTVISDSYASWKKSAAIRFGQCGMTIAEMYWGLLDLVTTLSIREGQYRHVARSKTC